MTLVALTDAARRFVEELRADEADADELALRIDVIGLGDAGREYSYELLFEPVAEAGPEDVLDRGEGLPVLVPADSIDKLRGATLDHDDVLGLVLRNPNRPSPAASLPSGTAVLEGSVEEKVLALLDGEINPSLAAHGGVARLDRIEGDVAYITMGGGCQGCGLAQVTLAEGIKAQIEERIPEIREVVDLTDHAAGDSPFFESV